MEKDPPSAEMKFCQNCRRDVALANYVAHELHCSRNTVSCQQCDVRLMKDRLQEHIDECHVDVKCDKCQTTCNKNNLLEHQKSTCPKRSKECSFCTLDVQLCDLKEHETKCGSRTETCPKCSRYVQLQDWKVHEIMGCQLPPLTVDANVMPRYHSPDYVEFPDQDVDDLDELVRQIDLIATTRGDVSRSSPPPPYSMRPPSPPVCGFRDDSAYPVRSAVGGLIPRLRYSDGSPPPNHRHGGGIFGELEDVAGSTMALHGSDTEVEDEEEDEEMFTRRGRGSGRLNNNFDSGSPSRYYPATAYFGGDEDDVKLPCEFCDELISADDLILHQSGCNHDINHASNTPLRYGSTTSAAHSVERALNDEDTDGGDEPSGLKPLPDSPRPHRYFDPEDLESLVNRGDHQGDHQGEFGREVISTGEAAEQEVDEELYLPCELCEFPYPQSQLFIHMSTCCGGKEF